MDDTILSPHFSQAEMACHCCGGCDLKPGFLDALEALRAAINRPIIVDDACRCLKHNGGVGGASHSYHLFDAAGGIQTCAADIKVPGMLPQEILKAAREIPAFTGFGLAADYAHVDTGHPLPTFWIYDALGRWQDSTEAAVVGLLAA